MVAAVSTERVLGFDALVLENRALRAVILPELGGRVWELHDLARGRQWIWHREDVALAAAGPGSAYDEVWAGGWEELFPNDAPGDFEGRRLPDHGEWWTTSWKVEDASGGSDTAIVRLVAETTAPRTTCTKEYRLHGMSAEMHVSYRIESRESEAFHFLFKQHLAVAIAPSCRLRLPGGQVTVVDPAFGTVLPGPGPYSWPIAAGVDLSRIPAHSSTAREFIYVSDLPQSWCGVDDEASGASLRMRFDGAQLPFVWLFLSYGGWRGCYTAVLEPCTNLPKDLAQAVRAGRSQRLVPGQVFATSATVRLFGGTGQP